jgi:hypothetical protein
MFDVKPFNDFQMINDVIILLIFKTDYKKKITHLFVDNLRF